MRKIILTETQLHNLIKHSLQEVKKVSGSWYIHKNYAEKYIPADIYQKALEILNQSEPNLEFDCLTWNPKTPQIVEFDVCSEFNTVTEPLIDRRIKVNTETNEVTEGKGFLTTNSKDVWHGKGDFWVDDDFQGFDRKREQDWRKEYLQGMQDYPMANNSKSGIQKTPVGGSRAAWLNHLMHIHKIDRYFEMNGINTYEDKINYLKKWQGGKYPDLAERYEKYLQENETV